MKWNQTLNQFKKPLSLKKTFLIPHQANFLIWAVLVTIKSFKNENEWKKENLWIKFIITLLSLFILLFDQDNFRFNFSSLSIWLFNKIICDHHYFIDYLGLLTLFMWGVWKEDLIWTPLHVRAQNAKNENGHCKTIQVHKSCKRQ